MSEPDAIVIGAGPAGLACAASLQRSGLSALILERADAVGAAWRRHYDRLHLHTDRGHSELSGLTMPSTFPTYPSRAQVVEYLESYASAFGLHPRFGTEVLSAERADEFWKVTTSAGNFAAPNVVVATGLADVPYRPLWPGEERFGGDIRHSSTYRNPQHYAGKRVLVVGLGNSGAEIALDLAEHGVAVSVSVRGPVNVVPRDLLGIPILNVAILLRLLPPAVADALTAPIVAVTVGPFRRLGLRRPVGGPFVSIAKHGKVPVLDIGTAAKLRDGTISVRPEIRALSAGIVEFADGRREPCDAIVAATGFRADLRTLLPHASGALDGAGLPAISGGPTAEPGLYFCGFRVSPAGQLREIGLEARRIAAEMARRAHTPRGQPRTDA